MVRVKICGITNTDDALAAIDYGADALGFVFYEKSPRYIPPEKAGQIIRSLPPFITTVGLFVDEDRNEVEKIIALNNINIVQFHGNESPETCLLNRRVIKAIRVKELSDLDSLGNYQVSAFLLDTYTEDLLGGTGQVFNWDIAIEAKRFGRIILAGGLTPENIEKAVKLVRPFAVDVSSGVEMDKGVKDHKKMKLFIKRAKGA